MDSVLKMVYSHIYVRNNGQTVYFSNGYPKPVVDYIWGKNKENTDFNVDKELTNLSHESSSTGWSSDFPLRNLHYYFIKFCGENNIVSENQITDDDSVFVFPIEILTTNFCKKDHKYRVKLDNTIFEYDVKDMFSEKILEHIKTGKVKILLCCVEDPCHHNPQLYQFEKTMESLGVDGKNIIYIAGNQHNNFKNIFHDAKMQFTYGYLPLQQQSKSMDFFPKMSSLGYISDIVRESDLDKAKMRPKKFLCFNRTMRPHRYYLAYIAKKYNLFQNGIFSFLNNQNDKKNVKNWIENFLQTSISNSELNDVFSFMPYEIDTMHLSPNERMGFTTDANKKDFYLNTYIHLISETSFFAPIIDEPFFSEKTFRPIINLQPFIMIGDYGSLRVLKELGFKTFDPFIDESYDLETDSIKRMRMIENEILKFNAMPIEQIHEWYYSIIDILVYNRNHFSSFKDINPFQPAFEMIKNLK